MLKLRCMSRMLAGSVVAMYGPFRIRLARREEKHPIGFAVRNLEKGETVEFDPCGETRDIGRKMLIGDIKLIN